MMKNMLKRLIQRKDARFAEKPLFVNAFLGLTDGTVNVPERPYYVYARLWNGEVVEAYNDTMPPIAGAAIRLRYTSQRYIVERGDFYAEPIPASLPPETVNELQWPGSQTLFVRSEQFLPGLVSPKSGLIVQVQNGILPRSAGGYVEILGGDLDMTNYLPVTDAHWAVIEYKDDGTLSVITGGSAATSGELLLENIPTGTGYALAAIRLQANQTEISQGRFGSDIVDLRFFKSGNGGSGDVLGPSYTNDNAIARFDGTTGKIIQNSNVIVNDAGTINIPGGQSYNIAGSPHGHNWTEIADKPSVYPPETHNHSAGDITSGTFANARIAQSNVTQHQAALSIAWSQLTGVPARREVLTAARTYYVRTDGNDSNNGLSNTSGGAFATIQRAIDVVATLDRSTYDVTIQVGSGTYNIGTTPITLKEGVGANKIYITGNVTTPSSVVIQSGALPSQTGAFFGDGITTQYEIKGFRFVGSSSYSCITIRNGTKLFFANCEFHTGFTYHIEALFGAIAEAVGNYAITGGASNAHITARSFAGIRVQSRTVTLSGTPAFAQFAECRYTAVMFLPGNTFSGSATGARYYVDLNAVIQSLGATLPGSTSGVVATGGQYA